jgi:hypothetical protein
MTLEDIYYIGQTIAVAVIVATLIAILVQAHQTNKIARAELTLNLWVHAGSANYSLMDSPEKAEFMNRALFGAEPLNDAEKLRFANLMGYALGMHEGAFMLSNRGLIESAAFARTGGLMRMYFQSPRVRKWWLTRREFGYDPAFRSIIDAIVTEIEPSGAVAPPKQETSA